MATAKLHSNLTGQTLDGRYMLEQRIGHGGFADVYRAIDSRVRKYVAIKVLHSEHTRNITDVERFRNEAKIAGRIDDEHFVKVSDFFQDVEYFCFVMEYLQGSTLRDVLRNLNGKPMSWPRAFKIAREICAGLEIAHSHDVIHRDIKPENIFLVRTRAGGEQVKVLDLGVAKILQEHYWAGLKNNLSNTGDIIGSPCYIAPEQVHGNRACSPRVDIYSLGIVMFEMITGMVPFRGSNAYETLYHHVHTEPGRPTVLVKGLNVPKPLEDIILCALSKDPEKRFRTAREMDTAIRYELEHQSTEQRRGRAAQIMPAVPDGVGRESQHNELPTTPREASPSTQEAHDLPIASADQGKAGNEPTTAKHVKGAAKPIVTSHAPASSTVSASSAPPPSPPVALVAPGTHQVVDNQLTPPRQGQKALSRELSFVTSPEMVASEPAKAPDAKARVPSPESARLRPRTLLMLSSLLAASLAATCSVSIVLATTIDTRRIDQLSYKVEPEFLSEEEAAASPIPAPPKSPDPDPGPDTKPSVAEPAELTGAEAAGPLPGEKGTDKPLVKAGEPEATSTEDESGPPKRSRPKRPPGPSKPTILTMATIAGRAAWAVKKVCKIHHMAGGGNAEYTVVFQIDVKDGTVLKIVEGKDLPTLEDGTCVIREVYTLVKSFQGATDLQPRFEYPYTVVH